MAYFEKCDMNEIFVGNINIIGYDYTELEGIKYRIGNVAYDIEGNKIKNTDIRPLFVSQASLNDYNSMKQKQLQKIRSGYNYGFE